MKKKYKAYLLIVVGLFLIIYYAALPEYAAYMDANMNKTTTSPPYSVNNRAQKLHDSLIVADLHADFLLWNRDLLERHDYGLVDLPRMQDGNLSLQAFTIVSKVPKGLNIHKNTADSDQITLLALAEHWPFKSLASLKERALYQARKLHDYAKKSGGQFIIIKTKGELADFIAARH
ncbi:Microsomal dipeptidase, partial [hydrothermal vent metagenome]